MAEIDLPDIDSGSWAKYQADQLGAYAQQKLAAQPAVETPAVETPAVEQPIAEAAPEPAPEPAKLPDWVPDYAKNTLATGTIQPGPAATARAASSDGVVFPVVGYKSTVQNHWGEVPGGSDLFAPRGTPVLAMRSGRVVEAGYNAIGGNSVLIQGSDGNQYYYAHFDQAPSVKPGQTVAAGTYLGPVGNTGDAANTGTHLHIGIGPRILLGADKYGGTGGSFDAVGMLRSALGVGPAPNAATNPASAAADLPPVDQQSYADQQQQVLQDYAQQKVTPPAEPAKSPIPFVDFAKDKIGGFVQNLQQTDVAQGAANPANSADTLQGALTSLPSTVGEARGQGWRGLGATLGAAGNVLKTGAEAIGGNLQQGIETPEEVAGRNAELVGREEGAPLTSAVETVASMTNPGKLLDVARGGLGAASAADTLDRIINFAPNVVQDAGDTVTALRDARLAKNLAAVRESLTPEAIAQAKELGFDATDPVIQEQMANWRGVMEARGEAAGPADGTTRLYRRQTQPFDPTQVSEEGEAGRWFSSDPKFWAGVHGDHVAYVDVPTPAYESMLANEQEMARLAGNNRPPDATSVLVDPEIARQAKPLNEFTVPARGEIPGGGPGAMQGAKPPADPIDAKIEAAFNGSPAKPGLQQRWQDFSQTMERLFADGAAPINRLGDAPEAARATYAGRAASAAQRVTEDLKPVYDELGNDPTMISRFNRYVGLQRYMEVAAAKGAGTRLGPGGITTVADAADSLTRLQAEVGPDGWRAIQRADRERQAAMDTLLQDKVNSGFLTQDVADALRTQYPHYNPVTVLQAINESYPVAGNRLTQIGNTIKRLTEQGSAADQLPAMQSAALAITAGHTNIMRNEAIKTILDAFKGQLNADGEALVPIKVANELRTGPNIAPIAGTPDLATIVTSMRGDQPGLVSFWKNGKRYVADLHVAPDVERAMKAMDTPKLTMVGKVAQGFNAPLRAGATVLSVPFQLRNAAFDAIDAFVRSGIKPNEIVRGYIDAARESPAYREYIAHGGGMGGFVMRDSPLTRILNEGSGDAAKVGKQLENMVRQSGGYVLKSPGEVGRLIKDITSLGPVRRVGEIIEQGPRMARYRQALAQGLTQRGATYAGAQQAATMAGRRITVDFSRMGDAMREINAIMPFSNAALQGSLNIARSLRDSPAARVRLAALVTAVASIDATNRLQPDRLADIPDYVRANSMVVLLPGAVPNPNGQPGYSKNPYVALPLRELGVMPYLISKSLDKLTGQRADLGQTIGNALGALNPVTGEPAAAGILGAVGREAIAQKSGAGGFDLFRGRPIVSETLQNKPAGVQATPQTSQSAIDAANVLNRSPFRGLAGEQSPVRIQHFVESLTGGTGRTLMGAADTISGKPSDLPPVVGGALSGIVKTYGGQTEQSAYNDRDAKMDKLSGQYRDVLEAFSRNDATIGPPPQSIENIPLHPREQADYRQHQLEFLEHILREAGPQLNAALASIPTDNPLLLRARAEALRELTDQAGQYAQAMTIQEIGADEIVNRVQNEIAADPRKLYPQQQYEPIPVGR